MRKEKSENFSLSLSKEEIKQIQSLLSWTKVALRYDDEEKKTVEKILHKIRKVVS